MNKEQLNKLESIRIESTSPSKKDKWTRELAKFYFDLLGTEKGIYGMKDNDTNEIVYVGEAIDMTWRMYEHFHQVRGIGENKGHNIADSFYKHQVAIEDIDYTNARDFLAEARIKYTPVTLWSQEDDGPAGNAARWVAEHDMIKAYKPVLNYNLVLPIVATKRSANKYTNENGRYE